MELQTMTPQLRQQVVVATAALPPFHLTSPAEGEIVESLDAGYTRIQNWAFIQGFAIAKESRKPTRQVFERVHHRMGTRNIRGTEEKDRKRTATKSRGTGC